MRITELKATLTVCRHGKPLAILDNFPGEGVEMRPDDLRAMAKALLAIADNCEQTSNDHARLKFSSKRTYPLV